MFTNPTNIYIPIASVVLPLHGTVASQDFLPKAITMMS